MQRVFTEKEIRMVNKTRKMPNILVSMKLQINATVK